MVSTRAALAVVTLALLVSGCAGDDPTSGAAPSSRPTSHSSHDRAGSHAVGHEAMAPVSEPPADADWNAADASYLTMMVAHHSQALDMTELAVQRAADPRVRRLADSIDAGQGREVIVMATWLVDHGQPEPTPDSVAAMSGTGMPGMLDEDQLTALAATDGAEFDRRFLQDMIQHHQGAVAMAEDLLGTGEDVRVVEMAAEVVAGQGAEIQRMRELLADLP